MNEKIVFFMRDYNDIDHLVPVIYKILSLKFCSVSIVFTTDIHFKDDYRIHFLKTLGDISIHHVSEFLSTEQIIRELMKNISNGIIVFDPIHDNFTKKVLHHAKLKGYASICLPHGVSSFINRMIAKKEINYNHISDYQHYDIFDYIVSANILYSKRFLPYMSKNKIKQLGSARFNREWINVLYNLLPEFVIEKSADKLKILIFLRNFNSPTHWNEVLITLDLLLQFPDVFVVVKHHTRNGTIKILKEKYPELAEANQINLVSVDQDINSVSLIKWADVILDLGTSISFDAIFWGKPILSMEYLHANQSTSAHYLKSCEMKSRDDTYNTIKSLIENKHQTYYNEEERKHFIHEVLYGGNPENILDGYLTFFNQIFDMQTAKHFSAQRITSQQYIDKLVLLITIPRSGSTWLMDSIRCHPNIELIKTGKICTELKFNKYWGRYPRDLSNLKNCNYCIELTDGQWATIPTYNIQKEIGEIPEKMLHGKYAIEKIHPEFFDFNPSVFEKNLSDYESKGIQVKIVYLVREPEAAITSFMNYQERNPKWYQRTKNDLLTQYMLDTYDSILKTIDYRKGLIVDYGEMITNLADVLQKIFHYLWPDLDREEMDFIIQVSQAAEKATAREKRLANANSSFLGSTVGSVRGCGNNHRYFFNRYTDEVKTCINLYESILLNQIRQQRAIPNNSHALMNSNTSDLLARGEKLFLENNLKEAEKIFKKIIQLDVNHFIAMNNLACIFWKTHRKNDAFEFINKAYTLAPDNTNILRNIGMFYMKSGLMYKTILFLSKYLKQIPEDTEVQQIVSTWKKEYYCVNKIYLLVDSTDLQTDTIDNLLSRLFFYLPYYSSNNIELITVNSRIVLNNDTICLGFDSKSISQDISNSSNYYDIDYRTNPTDAWSWCRVVNYCTNVKANIDLSRTIFRTQIELLNKLSYQKSYIFGTGASLEKALDIDWSDGYRIVCNTIVRDSELWNHINPHFIVAGDAIYHFGHTSFAKKFREDLFERLKETKTFFVYPELFHNIVIKDFEEFSDRLIPIPKGQYQKINENLSHNFQLPSLHNVLSLLLLPLACTLSKNIYLWGFDGRAPDDKLFWSNSKKHSYSEFIYELKESHPCFFEYFVPKEDKENYTKIAFGDFFETLLEKAENEGFRFIMMHKSWTPNLQKRYRH